VKLLLLRKVHDGCLRKTVNFDPSRHWFFLVLRPDAELDVSTIKADLAGKSIEVRQVDYVVLQELWPLAKNVKAVDCALKLRGLANVLQLDCELDFLGNAK
jgi:hypothetical protein